MGGFFSIPEGLRLPFATAQYGARPRQIGDWTLSNVGQPMSYGRSTRELAEGMYTRYQR